MTVSELIDQLKNYPPDFEVVQAVDEEGNFFVKTYDIGYGRWNPSDKEWSSWTQDDDEDATTERELTLDESNAICLWP